MNRTGSLATLALMLASSPSFAQMGGIGGGMGGIGGGMGGMGGQGMATGMMMQRGGFFGAGVTDVQRSVQVEMEGGQRLNGKIDFRPVLVDGDLGQYSIPPDKIKMIRFLKPVERGRGGREGRQPGRRCSRAGRDRAAPGFRLELRRMRAGRHGWRR